MEPVSPEPSPKTLTRIRLELDVTPLWWAETWARDAADVVGALAKSKHATEDVRIGALGVVVHVVATNTSSLADIEALRLKLWRELNDLAKGHRERQALISRARTLAGDHPEALLTGELPPPPDTAAPPDPKPPRGLHLFLAGSTRAAPQASNRRGFLWTPPAA